jgi:predicted esterase YcpF (UPF0227 family)
MLIYIHGLNSSPASFKANLLKRKLESMGRGTEFSAPALPDRPRAAAALLEAEIAKHPGASLVGSSLGGFYATWLAERHGLRAVLVNPAVRPYDGLRQFLGAQQNLYTGGRYELTQAHLDELAALELPAITRPERYLLMVETGDEVLDYREAVDRYRGCRQMVIEGGDHAFKDFGEYLDTVLEFCAVPALDHPAG